MRRARGESNNTRTKSATGQALDDRLALGLLVGGGYDGADPVLCDPAAQPGVVAHKPLGLVAEVQALADLREAQALGGKRRHLCADLDDGGAQADKVGAVALRRAMAG